MASHDPHAKIPSASNGGTLTFGVSLRCRLHCRVEKIYPWLFDRRPRGPGLWRAKEIGAFEKYRLQTELIFISSGPVVVQALVGGDLQGGFAATTPLLPRCWLERLWSRS
jgi:hypothetical protein